MVTTNFALKGTAQRAPYAPAWIEPPQRELLDESQGFLGMSRSLTFPFPQWRENDEHRTVYFDQGEGRTLVFVHGLGANATHWEFMARGLASRYRVVGLDLAGLGWTRKPDRPFTVKMLRDQLLDFMDRRGLGQVTLVGHSLGGAVCLDAALQRPGQVENLVLMCAAGVAPLPAWMRLAAPIFLRRALLYPTLLLGADFIVDNVFVTREKENPRVRWFRQSAMRDEPGNPNLKDFARVSETLCRDLLKGDYSDRLSSLQMPVLALWGDSDKLTQVSDVLRQLGRIRRIRTVMLKRCGHMPMVEYPEDTIFHLERFLKRPPQ